MIVQIADEIVNVLTPVIGKGMAQSAVSMQCRKIGIMPENLSLDNIDDFLRNFKKTMAIFAGDTVADEVVVKILATARR
jgi:hypothetical protein